MTDLCERATFTVGSTSFRRWDAHLVDMEHEYLVHCPVCGTYQAIGLRIGRMNTGTRGSAWTRCVSGCGSPDVRAALLEVGVPAGFLGDYGLECPTALYRWWDGSDLLLYIGIASNLGSRTKGHAKGSSWMDFAVRSTIERFPSRDEALDAEEMAIKTEKPLFNHQHNVSPEAEKRLVEYLVKRNRIDLLAPAVSRG